MFHVEHFRGDELVIHEIKNEVNVLRETVLSEDQKNTFKKLANQCKNVSRETIRITNTSVSRETFSTAG